MINTKRILISSHMLKRTRAVNIELTEKTAYTTPRKLQATPKKRVPEICATRLEQISLAQTQRFLSERPLQQNFANAASVYRQQLGTAIKVVCGFRTITEDPPDRYAKYALVKRERAMDTLGPGSHSRLRRNRSIPTLMIGSAARPVGEARGKASD